MFTAGLLRRNNPHNAAHLIVRLSTQALHRESLPWCGFLIVVALRGREATFNDVCVPVEERRFSGRGKTQNESPNPAPEGRHSAAPDVSSG
jgi:hypothetical protein